MIIRIKNYLKILFSESSKSYTNQMICIANQLTGFFGTAFAKRNFQTDNSYYQNKEIKNKNESNHQHSFTCTFCRILVQFLITLETHQCFLLKEDFKSETNS